MSFPAFKEWQIIVEALGAGEQIIILRKGGIAEGREGFQIEAKCFWLFPTHFHAQLEKTKPATARWFSSMPDSNSSSFALSHYAEVVRHDFLNDWPRLARLDSFHLWTEATVRDRFNWSQPPGLHVLVTRVHRLKTPVTVEITPDMAGCKSWISLPHDFADHPALPVLDEQTFAHKLSTLEAVMKLQGH